MHHLQPRRTRSKYQRAYEDPTFFESPAKPKERERYIIPDFIPEITWQLPFIPEIHYFTGYDFRLLFLGNKEEAVVMKNKKNDYVMTDNSGFSYYQVSTSKSQTHWRCCQFKNWKRKCFARVVTEDGCIVKKYGVHSHSGISSSVMIVYYFLQ